MPDANINWNGSTFFCIVLQCNISWTFVQLFSSCSCVQTDGRSGLRTRLKFDENFQVLMAVKVKGFWDVAPWGQILPMSQRNLLQSYSGNRDEGSSSFVQNAGEYLPEYTMSYTRIQQTSDSIHRVNKGFYPEEISFRTLISVTLHTVTSQKRVIFIISGVRSSDLTNSRVMQSKLARTL